MSVHRGLAGLAALLLVASPRAATTQTPSLNEIRTKAAKYVSEYASKVSGVSMDEQFTLIDMGTGVSHSPQRIASDLVVVSIDGYLLGLRDPYSIDRRSIRKHTPRLIDALTDPTPANWALAQQYVRANAALFLHNVVVWYTDPTLALQFAAAANQQTLGMEIDGHKTRNGVETYGVTFKEPDEGPRVLNQIPGEAQSSGRLWIDPATGAIHMTELWVQSQTDIVRVLVEFAPDPELGILLPKSASHNLQWREWGNERTTSGIGGTPIKASYESNAEYKKVGYTPLQLNGR
jgi:hypothetical protein